MRRRDFMTLIGGAVALPTTARAQRPAKTKRLAIINPSVTTEDMKKNDPGYAMYFEEIKRLGGYVEGVNLTVERYSAEGRYDRIPEIARQVVATRPDVIGATSNVLVLALKSETSTIPIVAWTSDPIVNGIIPGSLARPGGNITGVSMVAGPDFAVKRLELLVEAVGKLANARSVATPAAWEAPSFIRDRAGQSREPVDVCFDPKVTCSVCKMSRRANR
jgi:putative tryptophan/tyrosine transport system substrate-binding protein